jgi:Flp pilus assembly pilin Flp
MQRLLFAVRKFVAGCDGQDLMEYGLIATLIAIALILSVTSLGQAVNTVLWQPIAANV